MNLFRRNKILIFVFINENYEIFFKKKNIKITMDLIYTIKQIE